MATTLKPFRLSDQWVAFAHGPGAEAGYKSAVELCELITDRDFVLIPANRPDLVREVIDVAELYTGTRGGDREDRTRAASASRLIQRATKWLAEAEAAPA